jgi:hypothetical protein
MRDTRSTQRDRQSDRFGREPEIWNASRAPWQSLLLAVERYRSFGARSGLLN